jgi:hypothetical protein
MPGTNRHLPPTSEMLWNRVYRRQVRTEHALKDLRAEVARLTAHTEITATLADHCRRLLREKETMMKVIEANRFMNAALPRRFSVLSEYPNG